METRSQDTGNTFSRYWPRKLSTIIKHASKCLLAILTLTIKQMFLPWFCSPYSGETSPDGKNWDSLAGPTSHLACALAASFVSEMWSCICRGCCPMDSWQDVNLISPAAAKSVGKGPLRLPACPLYKALLGCLWVRALSRRWFTKSQSCPRSSLQHKTHKFVSSQNQSLVPFFTVVGPRLMELNVSFVIYLGEHTGSALQSYVS